LSPANAEVIAAKWEGIAVGIGRID